MSDEAAMTLDPVVATVSSIFAEAGWAPMPGPPYTGLYCAPVGAGYWLGGVAPTRNVHSFHTHMTEPPSDPIAKARQLVEMEGRPPAKVYKFRRKAASAISEPVDIPQAAPEPTIELAPETSEPEQASTAEETSGPSEGQEAGDPFVDAEFDVADLGQDADLLAEQDAELPALDAPDAPAEETPVTEQQDRFYGLDDLDRRKTVAIGLTMRHAGSLLPTWRESDDRRLAELRNFAMGVAENRWPDEGAKQAELQALETTVRRIAEIERTRDAKVAFIEAAEREAFDTFVVEAGWP